MRQERLYLAGMWLDGVGDEPVADPYSGHVVARVAQADAELADRAVAASVQGQEEMGGLATWERAEILRGAAAGIEGRGEELAQIIREEVGKPIDFARGEVARAVETFTLAAEETRRWGGEVLPLDIEPRATSFRGLFTRFPRGPLLAIAPFNFPLNLVAHKVAPAVAVGSAVVLKPPPQGPTAALRLAEILREAGLPERALSVLPCPVPVAQDMVEDPRFEMLSFTGSDRVGWMLKQRAGKKRVALELGGDAAAVVHGDADLEWAARRVAVGGFAFAGQVCISVQRVFVQEEVREAFVKLLLDEVQDLPVGDPAEEGVVVGPLIDGDAADRVQDWIREAEEHGARRLVGGDRTGNVLHPTVMAGVTDAVHLGRDEVFGPVVCLETYEDFDEALERVNRSRFGLQAAIFTQDVNRIHRAHRRLKVGGIVVNDYPMVRVDNFPYGGVKDSGFGREGIRSAMEEMSEPRMLIMRFFEED